MSARGDDLARKATGSANPAAKAEARQLPHAGVVVGLDGSPSSWDAFWWACGEAQRRGERLMAVFVTHATGASPGVAAAACALVPLPVVLHEWERAVDEEAAKLQADVQRFAAERDLEVAFVHCRGEPAKELLKAGEAAKADLIVVGKSCKARHHLAGSISRQLLAKVNAPVVVVVP
jgi:nucleotide-binding universal stress UspA family protein